MKRFVSPQEEQEIINAIKNAENQTSGEIRVHIESTCKENILDRAADVFNQLNMNATEKRNGVLIYLAINSKQFAIIGDKGINELVPTDFWNKTIELMESYFKRKQFTAGLIAGIEKAGYELKRFFPAETNDSNELNNSISFGHE